MEDDVRESPAGDERPRDLGGRVVTGLVWSYLSYAVIVVSQFIGLAVLARLLGPRDFGLFAIAVLFAEIGRTAFGMGLGPALVQLRGKIEDYLYVAWTANFLVSSLVTLILAVAVPFVARGFFGEAEAIWPAWALLTVVVLDGLRNPRNAILTRRLDMRRRFWLTAPPASSRYVASILFALYVPSVWALVFGYWLGHLLGLIVSYLVMPGRPRFAWDWRRFAELYSFGGWLQLKNVLRWSARNLDSVVVGRVLGAGDLGFYNRALALARLPQQQVTSVVDLVAFPMFAALQDGGRGRIRRAFKRNFDATSLIVFPILVPVLLFGEATVTVLLGAKWVAMTRAFQLLLVAVSLESLTQAFFPLLRGMGQSRREFWLHGLKLAAIAALLVPLTRWWGIEGAGLAVMTATLVAAPPVLKAAGDLAGIGLGQWVPTFMVCCLALLPIWPVAWGVERWLDSPLSRILVGLPVGWTLYLALLFACDRIWSVGPAGSAREALERLGRRWLPSPPAEGSES